MKLVRYFFLLPAVLFFFKANAQKADEKQKNKELIIETFSELPAEMDCCFLYIIAETKKDYDSSKYIFASNLISTLDLETKSNHRKTAIMMINGKKIKFMGTSAKKLTKSTDLYKYKSEEGYELSFEVTKLKDVLVKGVLILQSKDGAKVKKKVFGHELLN